jgi:hypothetical protein
VAIEHHAHGVTRQKGLGCVPMFMLTSAQRSRFQHNSLAVANAGLSVSDEISETVSVDRKHLLLARHFNRKRDNDFVLLRY